MTNDSFKALIVNKTEETFSVKIDQLTLNALPAGEVLIKVAYSSINYKDGLATIPDGNIVRSYPFVPGIDLAGVVVSSEDPRFHEGDEVIATSYEIGVSHFGGYSEYARIPADWVVPLPKNLTLKEAMIYGTAGFTAALSIYQLEESGVTPEQGKVLVTGSTGGVGSLACAMLSKGEGAWNGQFFSAWKKIRAGGLNRRKPLRPSCQNRRPGLRASLLARLVVQTQSRGVAALGGHGAALGGSNASIFPNRRGSSTGLVS